MKKSYQKNYFLTLAFYGIRLSKNSNIFNIDKKLKRNILKGRGYRKNIIV
jgi:hypothetical protein